MDCCEDEHLFYVLHSHRQPGDHLYAIFNHEYGYVLFYESESDFTITGERIEFMIYRERPSVQPLPEMLHHGYVSSNGKEN